MKRKDTVIDMIIGVIAIFIFIGIGYFVCEVIATVLEQGI